MKQMSRLLDKIIKPSTRAFFTEKADPETCSLPARIHGYIYSRWPYLYIGVGTGRHPLTRWIKPLWKLFSGSGRQKSGHASPDRGKIDFAHGYHGKALPVHQARKLVRINRNIEVQDLEQVIPYERARQIILKNPDHIVALDCPCRLTRDNPCRPVDVCLIIGEPFAGFILEHHPAKSRRISPEQAEDIIQKEHERGHVQHAFFKDAMLNRFYAICNCCACCCGAMQAHRNGVPMLASSGYTARIDHELCQECGRCFRSCQFRAISMRGGRPEVSPDLCLGCGVCVDRCRQGCITLKLDESKCTPLNVESLTG